MLGLSGATEAHSGVLYSSAYRAFRYIIVTRKHTYTHLVFCFSIYITVCTTRNDTWFSIVQEKTERFTYPKVRKNSDLVKKCSPRTTPLINFFTGVVDNGNKTVLPISACLHPKMKNQQKFNPLM
jgi:hypothetical protein